MSETMNHTHVPCPNCGEVIEADSRFCRHCAFEVNNSTTISNAVSSSGPSGTVKVVLVAVATLSILAATYEVWSLLKEKADSASVPAYKGPSAQTSITPAPNRFELTRDAALNLVRNRMTKEVTWHMRAGSLDSWTDRTNAYKELWRQKVLICWEAESFMQNGIDCKPGPNAKDVSTSDRGSTLVFVVGRKVPSVTGISKVDATSALAQVNLTFQPTNWFDYWTRRPGVVDGQDDSTQNEQHTIHLRLYDDGWRIEKIE
jgi:hypothetical protein